MSFAVRIYVSCRRIPEGPLQSCPHISTEHLAKPVRRGRQYPLQARGGSTTSIPTHRTSCQTWIYSTGCWYCGAGVHALQCTCGSVVLLDTNRPPWDQHDCSATGTLGRSGLEGWAAVDILRSHGAPISAEILSKIFPNTQSGTKKAGQRTLQTRAVQPAVGQKASIIAVVRDLLINTKKTLAFGGI